MRKPAELGAQVAAVGLDPALLRGRVLSRLWKLSICRSALRHRGPVSGSGGADGASGRSEMALSVLAQRLIPLVNGGGRFAAFEVMVATPAVRRLIRDGAPRPTRALRAVLASPPARQDVTMLMDRT